MIESPEDLYHGAIARCLAGYQLLEEQLKTYLGIYFGVVRALLPSGLHFGFESKEIENAPLERLVHLFSKACDDAKLVASLREVISHRNEVAHRALLLSYKSSPTTEEYVELSSEAVKRSGVIGELMARVCDKTGEIVKVLESRVRE